MKVPAVIYEVGDNTDRTLIRAVARTAAKEMMRLLLEEVESEVTRPEDKTKPTLIPKAAAHPLRAHCLSVVLSAGLECEAPRRHGGHGA